MFEVEEEKKPKANILGLLRPQSDLIDKSKDKTDS